MSVTGWFVMQLKSATIAGLKVDGKGFQGATSFLDKCTKGGQHPGLVAYNPARTPTYTITSVGMLCRQFMGWKRTDPLLTGGGVKSVKHAVVGAYKDGIVQKHRG